MPEEKADLDTVLRLQRNNLYRNFDRKQKDPKKGSFLMILVKTYQDLEFLPQTKAQKNVIYQV